MRGKNLNLNYYIWLNLCKSRQMIRICLPCRRLLMNSQSMTLKRNVKVYDDLSALNGFGAGGCIQASKFIY